MTKDPSTTAGPSVSELSLKEQLEARLHKDPDVEVHDTIRAILASLMTQGGGSAPSSKDTKSGTDAPASVSSRAPVPESTTGKGKAVSFDVPATTTVTVASSKDVVESMNAVHNIQAAFETLSSDFSFPSRLDFTPTSSVPSSPHVSDSESVSTSRLAYTSRNAPVRYYEQALSALLSQLDAVESWGNEEVRIVRKEIVARVETALEEVEKEVQERFVQRLAREAGGGSVEVDEKGAEEKPRSGEVPVSEFVQVGVPTRTAHVEGHAIGLSAEPVEMPTSSQEASLDEEQAGGKMETTPTSDAEPNECSTLSDEKTSDDTEDSVRSVSQTVSSQLANEFVSSERAEPLEGPSLAGSAATVISADKTTTTRSEFPSYPPTSSLAPVTEPASRGASGLRTDSDPVDTFLLPAATELVIPNRLDTNEEDEVVVVDKEHGEASDGDNWSEVEA
jgi:hypothetical protein